VTLELVRVVLLVGAICYALKASQGVLRTYCASLLAYTFLVEACLVTGLPLDSWTYRLVWAGATAVVLFCALLVTTQLVGSIHGQRAVWRYALIGASLCGLLGYRDLNHARLFSSAVALATGVSLAFLGAALIAAASHLFRLGQAGVAVSLGSAWIVLAGWNLGWTGHLIGYATWDRLNFVVPTLTVVAAMVAVGYSVRAQPAYDSRP
jgi:hypothetical protein